jgi:hypothetical protein
MENISKIKELGGWIILFCLSAIANSYWFIKSIIKTFRSTPNLNSSDIALIVQNLVLLALVIFLLKVLYFRPKRYAPKVAIIYCWFVLIFTIVGSMLVALLANVPIHFFIEKTWTSYIPATLSSTLWTLYFMKSKKVNDYFSQLN